MKKLIAVVSALSVTVLLAACAGMLTGYQTKVDPVDQKYIEAETNLKNAYLSLAATADKEQEARRQGSPVGSVITKDRYDKYMNGLDQTTKLVREARKLQDNVQCLDLAAPDGSERFPGLDLKGCFTRESAALVALLVVQRINSGGF